MIVLEGPDASGKSTLAKYLASKLAVPVQHSEGPEKYPGEMAARLAHYATLPDHVLHDRHPCISGIIYGEAFDRPITVSAYDIIEFYERDPLIIYCAPSIEVEHIVKDHDTPEHLAQVAQHKEKIEDLYRKWADTYAHIIYRIGDPPQRILHHITNFTQDISDFHYRFGIEYSGQPRYLPHDLSEFRVKFMAEELCEYIGVKDVTRELIQSALLKHRHASLEQQLDALVDLVYVALGTAHLQGFDFTAAWARVHRANMTKVRATHAHQSTRAFAADVIKPPGFKAPDLGDLVLG